MTVVACGVDALDAVRTRLETVTISTGVTDEAVTQHIVAEIRPDGLVNASATPRMGRVDQVSWGRFQRGLGDRRQGWALLDPGGAQPAAQARKPRPGDL